MENIVSIEDYIHTTPSLQIGSRKKNPVPSIIVMVCGIALCVLTQGMDDHHDSLQMTVLSIGVAAIIAGAIMFLLCFGKSVNYVYQPTKSPMRLYHCYVANGSRNQVKELVSSGNMELLKTVRHEISTNTMVDVLISNDGACALLQVEEYGTTFEPASSVCQVTGAEVQKVKIWLDSRS